MVKTRFGLKMKNPSLKEPRKKFIQSILIPAEANVLNAKIVKVPRCYPVYETGYQDDMNKVIDFLKGINGLHVIGRLWCIQIQQSRPFYIDGPIGS